MKIKDLSDYKDDEIAVLIARIPFFKQLQESDQQQLALLLRHSCIVELEPGETIMRRGERGSWLYFLIKGRLSVYLDAKDTEQPISQVTPGELFGDLALLCDYQRKATVAADNDAKHALLFATDFHVFGDLLDFTDITVSTKLIFYRTMVHSIRWRLEVTRMHSPDPALIAQLRQVPTYTGLKGGVEELEALFDQAKYLASLLERWNSRGMSVQDVVVVGEAEQP